MASARPARLRHIGRKPRIRQPFLSALDGLGRTRGHEPGRLGVRQHGGPHRTSPEPQGRVGYTVNLIGGRRAYVRFDELVGPHLVGAKRAALAALRASYASTRTLLARGTVDVVPADLCREPLREAILKRFSTLKAGCRALGLAYRLVARDRRKGGIRRDTVEYLADRLDAPALHALVDPSMGWSRPKRFVLEGVEPTYDFEVPGTRSFIANGIAVHNSHAAAYGR